jgi:hypothetical protein
MTEIAGFAAACRARSSLEIDNFACTWSMRATDELPLAIGW